MTYHLQEGALKLQAFDNKDAIAHLDECAWKWGKMDLRDEMGFQTADYLE